MVIPNLQASQTHPKYWGEDSLEWKPQRWILPPPSSTPSQSTITNALESESFKPLPKIIFFAWSEGMQSCPGKKFAQVEFVAVMASLFTEYRAEPVPKVGESLDGARIRLKGVVEDSTVELLLTMKDPKGVGVRWLRR